MLNRLIPAAFISIALTAAPPHHKYGPEYIGHGNSIRVDLDTVCNVFAVDSYNYEKYKNGASFNYFGGRATKSPFFIHPPSGTYYIVLDNGGDGYNLRAGVHVIQGR